MPLKNTAKYSIQVNKLFFSYQSPRVNNMIWVIESFHKNSFYAEASSTVLLRRFSDVSKSV